MFFNRSVSYTRIHPTELEESQLSSCYREALMLSIKKKISTIAFPCLATRAHRYPIAEASKTEIQTILNVLKEQPDAFERIVLCTHNARDTEVVRSTLEALLEPDSASIVSNKHSKSHQSRKPSINHSIFHSFNLSIFHSLAQLLIHEPLNQRRRHVLLRLHAHQTQTRRRDILHRVLLHYASLPSLSLPQSSFSSASPRAGTTTHGTFTTGNATSSRCGTRVASPSVPTITTA